MASAPPLSPAALERYGLKTLRSRPTPDLSLAEDAARFLRAEVLARHPEGRLGALFLDGDARPLGYALPNRGYARRSELEPRQVLVPGLLARAAGLIFFERRDGAGVAPRPADLEAAVRLRDAGEIVGLRLLDHLLLGSGGGFTSLRAAGKVYFAALGESPRLPLLARGRPRVDRRADVRPKYVDPERPENTWSGRGRMARWLREKIEAGAKLEDFLAE